MTNCSRAETQQLHIHSELYKHFLFQVVLHLRGHQISHVAKSCYGTICPNIPGSMTRIFSIIPANKQQHIKPNI